MVLAKGRAGVMAEDALEQGGLRGDGIVRGGFKGGEPTADRDRDDLDNEIAEEPVEHGWFTRVGLDSAGQVFFEEFEHAAFVFIGGQVKCLVVFGLFYEPKFLRLLGQLE